MTNGCIVIKEGNKPIDYVFVGNSAYPEFEGLKIFQAVESGNIRAEISQMKKEWNEEQAIEDEELPEKWSEIHGVKDVDTLYVYDIRTKRLVMYEFCPKTLTMKKAIEVDFASKDDVAVKRYVFEHYSFFLQVMGIREKLIATDGISELRNLIKPGGGLTPENLNDYVSTLPKVFARVRPFYVQNSVARYGVSIVYDVYTIDAEKARCDNSGVYFSFDLDKKAYRTSNSGKSIETEWFSSCLHTPFGNYSVHGMDGELLNKNRISTKLDRLLNEQQNNLSVINQLAARFKKEEELLSEPILVFNGGEDQHIIDFMGEISNILSYSDGNLASYSQHMAGQIRNRIETLLPRNKKNIS